MRALSEDKSQAWLSRCDALAKMAVTFIAALATIAISNPWAQGLLLAASLAYFLSLRKFRAVLYAYLIFAAMVAAAVAFAQVTAFFFPALGKGLEFSKLAVPFMRAMTMMNVVIPFALTSSVQNILHSLQRLRLPFAVYLPAAVIIRFIPTFAHDVRQIAEALKIRGWDLSVKTVLLHPVRTTKLLFGPLLIRTLKTSDELGVAAELKGLNGKGRITVRKPFAWNKKEWLLLSASLLILAGAVFIQITLGTDTIGMMK